MDKFSNGLLSLKLWQVCLLLAAVVFLIYGQAVGFGFSYLDDQTLILDNFGFISNPSNILESFGQDVFFVSHSGAFYYRPFLTLSFMFDAFFGGKNPAVFHFSNILIHAIAACLLYVFLKKLDYGGVAPFWASLIFAVHPALAMAVNWIPGRNDSILAVFILASFIFLVSYLKSFRLRDLVWHLAFLAAALFTKETAVFAPILFILYVFLKRKDIFSSGWKSPLNNLLIMLIGWLILMIFWLALRTQALGGGIIQNSLFSQFKSFCLALPAVIIYLGKTIFPFNLSVYPILAGANFVYGIAALILLVLVIYFFRKIIRFEIVVFGFAWFFIFLLPSFVRPSEVMPDFLEHRAYLPMVGLVIAMLGIGWEKTGIGKKMGNALLVGLVLLLGILTVFYSRNFTDRVVFWKNAAENSPRAPLAHRNLGAMYWLDGKIDEAEKEYREALDLNSLEPMAHNNLGLIFARKGDYESAVKEYLTELEINPGYDNALFNLGLSYWSLGKKDEAAKKWREILGVNPDYLEAYRNLAIYYEQKGDKKSAQQYLEVYLSKGGEPL